MTVNTAKLVASTIATQAVPSHLVDTTGIVSQTVLPSSGIDLMYGMSVLPISFLNGISTVMAVPGATGKSCGSTDTTGPAGSSPKASYAALFKSASNMYIVVRMP